MKSSSQKSKLAIPVFIYSFASFVSKISGYLRDLFLASFVGTSVLSDIFLIAFRLPYSFKRAVSEESLNPAFIPIYGKSSDSSNLNKKYEFTRKVFLVFLLFAVLLTVVAEIFMEEILQIFSYGFSDPLLQELLITSSRIIFPYVIFIVLTSVLMANLNANNKFGVTGAIASVLNLTIVGAIVLTNFYEVNKLLYLSYTVIIGGFFQALVLFTVVDRNFWTVLISLKRYRTSLKEFYSMYWPTLVYSSFFQINLIIGIFLCSLEEGAVSYIYYSERLFYFPLTLIGIAIGVVLVPNLSNFIRENENDSARDYMNRANKYALITILPLTGFLLGLSPEIVSFLFERGEFTAESTKNTSMVLTAFLLGLPAATLVKILTPYFFAIETPRIYLRVTTYSNLINLILMLILYKYIGFLGIPIALSVSSYALFFLLLSEHKKKNFFSYDNLNLSPALKYLALSILIFFSCKEISELLILSYDNVLITLFAGAIYSSFVFIIFLSIFDKEILIQTKEVLLNIYKK